MVTVTLYGRLSLGHTIANSFVPFRCFLISVLAALSIGFQNYHFAYSASSLTSKLRSLSFRATLRQDSKMLAEFCLVSPYNFFSFSRIL